MNFKNLNDAQLEQSFKFVVRQERKILHEVIRHIQEVEKRKLYLKTHKSLFDYLIKEMKYSNAAAVLQIGAARLSQEIPEVIEQIESGGLNLSKISEINKAVSQATKLRKKPIPTKKKIEILNKVKQATHEETQKICAQELDLPTIYKDEVVFQKDGTVKITTTMTMEEYLDLQGSSEKLAQKQFLNYSDFRLGTKIGIIAKELQKITHRTTDSGVKWHSLTPKRKQQIKTNACEYKLKNGQECGSHFQLEIDHVRPKHQGGTNDPRNLRTLCRQHNQYRNYVPKIRNQDHLNKSADSGLKRSPYRGPSPSSGANPGS